MSAKCPCQNCNVNIEFEADQAGQTVACPKCGMDTLLFIPRVQSPPAAIPEPAKPASNWKYPPKTKSQPDIVPASPKSEQIRAKSGYGVLRSLIDFGAASPKSEQILVLKERLAAIRAKSGYGVLRSLIDFGAGVLAVASVLMAIALLALAPGSNDPAVAIVIALIGLPLSIVLIIALRQSALLLIDIADILLQCLAV